MLCDAAGFAALDVGVTELIEEGGFASVHVAEDADDGTTENFFLLFVLFAGFFGLKNVQKMYLGCYFL